MNGGAVFLESLGEILNMSGAPGGLQTKRDLMVRARRALATLRAADAGGDFSLTDDAVLWGDRPIEMEPPEWLSRLRAHGITVLAPPNDEVGFERWVTRLAGQLAPRVRPPEDTSEASAAAPGRRPPWDPTSEPPPPERPPAEAGASIFDEIGAIESSGRGGPGLRAADRPVPVETPARSVQAQADLVWEIHRSAARGGRVSFAEAASVATTLAGVLDEGSLGAESTLIAPLDEYATSHALNVCLAAMRLATHLAFAEDEVVAVGVAGLLHDIGKVRLGDLPAVSPEMLSSEERMLLQAHPEEGARILLDAGLGLAAVVAYEHHMPWRGEGGYPHRHFEREPGRFSRIVSVCDAFDVLTSERSFRPALGREAATGYLRLLGGNPLDPDLVSAFLETLEGPFPRVWTPLTRPPAEPHEIGWLPETGYDWDCEPRPVRL